MKAIKLMIPAFLIVTATYGFTRYTYGTFLVQIKEDFGLGPQMIGWIGGLPHFSYMAGTILAIILVQKLGLKKPIMLGGLLAAIGLSLVAISDNVLLLITGTLIGGTSGGFVWTAMPKAVTRLVDTSKQKQVITFVNAGPALAIFLTGPLELAFHSHWQTVWGIFSGVALLSLIWIYRALPSAPLDSGKTANKNRSSKKVLLTHGKSFFAASLICGLGTGVYVTYAVQLIHELDIHIPVLSQFPQLFMSFIGLISLASIFTGTVLKKISLENLYVTTAAVLSTSVILLPFSFYLPIILLSAVMFGLSFFTYFALLVLWGVQLFFNHHAEANGVMLLLIALGQFIAPVIFGYLLDVVSLPALFASSGILLTSLTVLKPTHEKREKKAIRRRVYTPKY